MAGVRLAEHCLGQLENFVTDGGDNSLCSDLQFVRVVKLIAEPYLNMVKESDRPVLRDYLIDLSDHLALNLVMSEADSLRSAVLFFKQKISEGSMMSELQKYLRGAGELLLRLKQGQSQSKPRKA